MVRADWWARTVVRICVRAHGLRAAIHTKMGARGRSLHVRPCHRICESAEAIGMRGDHHYGIVCVANGQQVMDGE